MTWAIRPSILVSSFSLHPRYILDKTQENQDLYSLAPHGELVRVGTSSTVSSCEARLHEVYGVHHRHLSDVQVIRLFDLLQRASALFEVRRRASKQAS